MLKFNQRDPGHRKLVADIIVNVARQDGDWQTIVARVSQSFVVKNWLHVRGVLQVLKDQGIITRDSNTRVEQFHLI